VAINLSLQTRRRRKGRQEPSSKKRNRKNTRARRRRENDRIGRANLIDVSVSPRSLREDFLGPDNPALIRPGLIEREVLLAGSLNGLNGRWEKRGQGHGA